MPLPKSNGGCQMAIVRFLDRMCLALQTWRTMAPPRYAAKCDPFLSLHCARVEGGGRNAIWHHWVQWGWAGRASPPNEASKQGQGRTRRRRMSEADESGKKGREKQRMPQRKKERKGRRIAFEDEQQASSSGSIHSCRRVISGNQNKCTPRHSRANDRKKVHVRHVCFCRLERHSAGGLQKLLLLC